MKNGEGWCPSPPAAVLVDEGQPTGHHAVEFDASDLASGVYVYSLQAGYFVQSRKMLVIK